MKFSKLLLASAIVMSSSAFAMESMTDESLSETSGQSGITLSVTTPAGGISFETRIHDGDGFSGFVSPGAIVLGGAAASGVKTSIDFGVVTPLVLTIDAGSNGVAAVPVLNIGVAIPTGTIIHTGTLAVARSTGMGNALGGETNAILNDTTITLGATTLNIQLGNAPQGAMAKIATTITGGINMAGFALNDLAGGSSISATNILIKDNGAAPLTVGNVTVGVAAAGLVVTLASVGSAGGIDTQITGLKLGTGAAIGNVEVIGLNLNGTTITVAGH